MHDQAPESDPISPLVAQVFEIDSVLWARPGQPFVVRYQGRLLGDSDASYQKLDKALKRHKLMPLFLVEDDQQVVQLVDRLKRPRPSNPWINLALFLLTLLSMLIAGALYVYEGPSPESMLDLVRQLIVRLDTGVPFALSLMAILLAHEFGHYLAARYHKTEVSLPYFLPFPLSILGTLGAFIQLKEPPRNRRVLLDIGLAGPLAGFVVAIPILFLGLSLSEISTIPEFIAPGEGFRLEGNSLLYLFSKYLVHGQLLPAPASFGDGGQFAYWLKYFFTGLPTPLGGTDIMTHSIAWAGWAGLLVTALNLIPAGQLDGGHLLYSLFGRRARLALPFILLGLAALGFFWNGWWLWVFLILLMGQTHAQPLDQITELDGRRRALAVLGLIIFVLVLTPIPLREVYGPYFGP